MDMNELLESLIVTEEVMKGSAGWLELERAFDFSEQSRIFVDDGLYEIFDPERQTVITIDSDQWGDLAIKEERPFTDYI